ncbi:MAG: Hsp70 family protein [Gammaproteobacteria bacterium]|nr:Hsp70 family protein [Gammaproteobacteria bacterium]
MSGARYAVGIDLGTTHSALTYAPLDGDDDSPVNLTVMSIPQLTAPGTVDERLLLPSFLYLPHPSEMAPGDLTLPWQSGQTFAVGELAREQGSKTPIRLVSSAKSWLCHPGLDRRAPVLPVDAPEEVERVSPLLASTRYLEHLRDAWNYHHPDAPLEQQQVTVTIPASFDPAARELTAEAAQTAGFQHLTLLEEPQAAVYSWIQQSNDAWRAQVQTGDIILVVDVGGGTTDLTLVAVTEHNGNLELNRIAVGDHILLGGDNMDLALAHVVRTKLAQQGTQLEAWQLRGLTHGCRAAKEVLLSSSVQTEVIPIVVPSRSSRLIGGSLRSELTREEVMTVILEGFFPRVDTTARPMARARTALSQLGLPYAQDAAITRHLAAFLGRQARAAAELQGFSNASAHADFIHPTAILFNGGVFKSALLVERLLEVVNGWLTAAGAAPLRLLRSADLDLAVARGAAYYGAVRQGRGVRIRGGTARAYYVGVESAMPAVPGFEPPLAALCVAPFGMEEGSEAALPPQEFGLVVGEPVRFRFFGSPVRRQDRVGTLLEDWAPDELEELGEIEATLSTDSHAPGAMIPVRLHAAVTEIGTLRLEAVPRSGTERWKVEFDVRGSQG